jgi:hypothetical protein
MHVLLLAVQTSAHILMGATTATDENAVLKSEVCTLAHLTVGLSHVRNISSRTAAAPQQHPQQQQTRCIQAITKNRIVVRQAAPAQHAASGVIVACHGRGGLTMRKLTLSTQMARNQQSTAQDRTVDGSALFCLCCFK